MTTKILPCYFCECETLHKFSRTEKDPISPNYGASVYTCTECHTENMLVYPIVPPLEIAFAIFVGVIACAIVIRTWLS